jgi:hypothetical protein
MKEGYILFAAKKSRVYDCGIILLLIFLLFSWGSFISTPKHSYNLKIEAGEGGTIPAGKEIDINRNYEEGSKIPIIARSNVGYYFVNWASNNGGTFADANDSQTTFTMPGKDTIVTAHFALEKIK